MAIPREVRTLLDRQAGSEFGCVGDELVAWLIQQLDELSEKSEYQDRALLYEIKKLMAEIDERTMQLQGEIDGQSWNHLNW